MHLIAKNYIRNFNRWKEITDTNRLLAKQVGEEELEFARKLYNEVNKLIDVAENVILTP